MKKLSKYKNTHKSMVELDKGHVLGNTYEYLINMVVMKAGKKTRLFYTSPQVSEVMPQIIEKSGEVESIYAPTVGPHIIIMLTANCNDDD
ncbi:MAG: N-6 DNA methylase [Tissierellia bacterium]|nr:N-6 DNA methylase [Tissierellia bacterium]